MSIELGRTYELYAEGAEIAYGSLLIDVDSSGVLRFYLSDDGTPYEGIVKKSIAGHYELWIAGVLVGILTTSGTLLPPAEGESSPWPTPSTLA